MSRRCGHNEIASQSTSTIVEVLTPSFVESDNYLAAHGLQLDYIREHDGFHWLASRSADEVHVGSGKDSDEAAMIAHVLATPLAESDVLIGQTLFDFGRELSGHDALN